MKNLKQELTDRWLLYQHTSDELFEKMDAWEGVFYCGFDPTADSLHLWNFIGFMVAIHFMRRWNKYIALTWWATWMIWDPGWKDSERTFLTEADLENNQQKISVQITNVLNNLEKFTWNDFKFDFINNKVFYEWMSFLDFLREVWKFMTVNSMINKESVKKRIEDPSKSISYTEFSYQLLQAYDFAKMNNEMWVNMQIGWQDQWWNLVWWTELIRKKFDKEAYALTWPLITDSSWKKFWKSEWNAMFLDKDKTTPYFIYQYFMNVADEDLSKYLKMLTLIETEEIDKIVTDHLRKPENRAGQKLLAFSVVEIIHWVNEAKLAENISNFMFWDVEKLEILKSLNDEELQTFKNAMWGFDYSGQNLFETMVTAWLEGSNSNARNSVKSGAIFINEQKIEDFNYDVEYNFINDKFLLLRKWKKNFRLLLK